MNAHRWGRVTPVTRHASEHTDDRATGVARARNAHAEQHRQEPLLDGPLPAARQVDGAADRGDAAHGAAVARRGGRRRGRDLRHGGRVPPDPAAVERPAGQPHRLPGVRREQPLLAGELDRRGAAQRPRGAQQHHGRRLGEPERPVARAQRAPARQPRPARPRRADRIGEEAGGDDLRRRAGDAAARRGLQLPAARRLPRARRQHRAHPRHQVSSRCGRTATRTPRSSTTSPGRRCWPASARCAPTGASIAARSIP